MDEMCVNFIYYYPRIELEVCKSNVDPESLQKYFSSMNRYLKQLPSPKPIPCSTSQLSPISQFRTFLATISCATKHFISIFSIHSSLPSEGQTQ